MVASVELIDPQKIQKNPDNPRLIFRQSDLDELRDSISQQGILVPLAVFKDGKKFTLLDGERRWRCAIALGLHRVPAIIQPKPGKVQNIMMMFAIHNARRDWAPLPTALKLQQLEEELERVNERPPSESELAAAASIRRGEVRRYRKILRIPKRIQAELLLELDKPRNEQEITVDQVIEASDAAEQLAKAELIPNVSREKFIRVCIQKFKAHIIHTVEPRKLSSVARAVRKGEVPRRSAAAAITRFVSVASVSIDDVYEGTAASVQRGKQVVAAARRLASAIDSLDEGGELSDAAKNELRALRAAITRILK